MSKGAARGGAGFVAAPTFPMPLHHCPPPPSLLHTDRLLLLPLSPSAREAAMTAKRSHITSIPTTGHRLACVFATQFQPLATTLVRACIVPRQIPKFWQKCSSRWWCLVAGLPGRCTIFSGAFVSAARLWKQTSPCPQSALVGERNVSARMHKLATCKTRKRCKFCWHVIQVHGPLLCAAGGRDGGCCVSLHSHWRRCLWYELSSVFDELSTCP